MNFNSLENKELLWDILQEDGYFNDIRPSLIKNIKTEFENTILEMSNININDSLINKNKNFITNFTYKLKALNSTPFQINDHNPLKLNDIDEIYKAQDFKKNRQEQMNMEFANKKKEMDSMLIANKPGDINFSELNSKEEPIQNIDDILKNTIAQRNIEIDSINNSYDKTSAEKWIGSEKKITFKEETENIIIQPHDIIEPNTPEPIKDPIDFSKLFDLLDTIIKNQNKILKHLNIS